MGGARRKFTHTDKTMRLPTPCTHSCSTFEYKFSPTAREERRSVFQRELGHEGNCEALIQIMDRNFELSSVDMDPAARFLSADATLRCRTTGPQTPNECNEQNKTA